MWRGFLVGICLGLVSAMWSAHAAPPSDYPSDGACGAVNVLNSAATEVPCAAITLGKTINSCSVQNLGANVIYCNFGGLDGGPYLLDGGLSTSVNWGVQVPASGGYWSFDMRTAPTATAKPLSRRLWCQAKTADQTTGETNTRFCGVR